MVDRLTFATLWFICTAGLVEARKPNLIVILAADLGAGDLGCYGALDVKTPAIDSLAKEGVKFRSLYSSAPLPSPARAGLLTGRIPARAGLSHEIYPADLAGLPTGELTIAELLVAEGYATAFVGKWQLGAAEGQLPPAHGFGKWYGIPRSAGSMEWLVGEPFSAELATEPLALWSDGEVVESPVALSSLTARFTEEAVSFVEENKEKPFFLCLAPTSTDRPLYADREFIGKSARGIYGDCIAELDWSVGQVMQALEDSGIADDTLIFFTSDNGPLEEVVEAERNPHGERGVGGDSSGLRGGRGSTFEGGVRVPGIIRFPSVAKAGMKSSVPVSHLDLLPTFLNLAELEPPDDLLTDGLDITSVLAGEDTSALDEREICHYFGAQLQAIRRGKWKLFLQQDSYPEKPASVLYRGDSPERFQKDYPLRAAALYDLSMDQEEGINLAPNHPEIVKELSELAANVDGELQASARSPEFAEGMRAPKIGQLRRASADLEMPSALVLEKGIVYSEPWGSLLSLDLYLPVPAPVIVTPAADTIADGGDGEISDEPENTTSEDDGEELEAPEPPLEELLPLPVGAPAVVLVHGGYWVGGSPNDMRPLAIRLAAAGYAVVCPSYRLADRLTKSFPGALDDIKTSISWLRENAGSRGIDPSRIALAGSGAGGHLAALAALQDPEIRGVCVLGGAMDLAEEGMASRSREDAGYYTNQLLGGNIVELPELYANASPVTHLSKASPPFIFITGSEDSPGVRSESFRQRCENLAVEAELKIIDGGSREMWKEHPYVSSTLSEMVAFLARFASEAGGE